MSKFGQGLSVGQQLEWGVDSLLACFGRYHFSAIAPPASFSVSCEIHLGLLSRHEEGREEPVRAKEKKTREGSLTGKKKKKGSAKPGPNQCYRVLQVCC